MSNENDTEYDITGLTGTLNLAGLASVNPVDYGKLMYQAGILSERLREFKIHIMLNNDSFMLIRPNMNAINAIILDNYSIINPMVTSDGLLMVMKIINHIRSTSYMDAVIDYLKIGKHTDDDMIAFIMYFSAVNGFSDSDAISITGSYTAELNSILISYDSRCPFIRGFNTDYDNLHVSIMLRMNDLLKQGYPIEYAMQDAAIQRGKELGKLIRKLRRIEKDARNEHNSALFKPVYNQPVYNKHKTAMDFLSLMDII